MCVSRWAKSNRSCSGTKYFQANDRLFLGKSEHVAIVPLEQLRTANSEWYTIIWLPVVFQEIRKTNRWLLYTTTMRTLTHLIKNKMRGQRFLTPEEAVDAYVLEIPQSEWQKCLDNWFTRMQKWIDLSWKYFEKQ